MKRWLKRGAIATFIIVVAAFAVHKLHEDSDTYARPEDYAVYSAFLTQALIVDNEALHDAHHPFVILDHTVEPRGILPAQELSAASVKMRDDLNRHNLRSLKFDRKFDIQSAYHLLDFEAKGYVPNSTAPLHLSPDEIKALPNGDFVAFTRITFNADSTLALFYVEHQCGGLCGGGAFILMQKQAGQWKILDQADTWMS
jgi:hypothetical protein